MGEEFAKEIKAVVDQSTKEFNKDIESFFIESDPVTKDNIEDRYIHFLNSKVGEWIVISDISNPTEASSTDLMFRIIERLIGVNFEKQYNKLRIIK